MRMPHEEVARLFMQHKGYGDLNPLDIEKLEDENCWYFFYQLAEGTLEVEVSWNESTNEWETTVTTFKLTT